MDFTAIVTSLQTTLGAHLPMILGAIGILVLGWIIAVIVRAGVRRATGAAGLNRRLGEVLQQKIDVEGGLSMVVFWLIIAVTLAAMFSSLDLESVSAPFALLVSQFLGFVPNLVAGGVLLLVAWVLATALRAIASRLLAKTTLDDRLVAEAGMEPVSDNIGNILFWLVILLFTPIILSALSLTGLLHPVENMINQMLGMVPDIFAAFVIGAVGYVVAKALRGLVTSLLSATGIDRHSQAVSLSALAGTLVFIFVFFPALIAALDALKIESISRPATDMLSRFLAAIPDIFAAAVILGLTYLVANFVAGLLARLLSGLGADRVPEALGHPGLLGGNLTVSGLASKLAVFFAMLFATVEAANRVGFTQVRDVVTTFIQFGGDVLLGTVIVAIGFWLAGIVHSAISRSDTENAGTGAGIARFAILGLVIAMGLRAMGVADDIVNLAFGLILGAVALAIGLSFGLGGREAAGRQMEYWLAKLRKD
ncbi:MAG: mechanosensitive ion channel [Sterolibacteriaceae bacterium]|nr:mechanosensitive ion channel [Sterolibacteriaceae bacterium]